MKTITLTFMQRVRLTLIMRAFVGTRGDSKTRAIRDLRVRIGVSEMELEKYVRFIDDERLMLIMEAIDREAASDVTVTAEEARLLLAQLDGLPLRVVDMTGWADALGKTLEGACA